MTDNHISAVTICRSRAVLKDLELFDEILRNPGKSILELAEKIGQSGCATREHVHVLVIAGLVEIAKGPSPHIRKRQCDVIYPRGYLLNKA